MSEGAVAAEPAKLASLSDLATRRLRRELLSEGWTERDVENFERFGRNRCALLYDRIDRPGGVRVNVAASEASGGTPRWLSGTLVNARSDGCVVLLAGEREEVPGTKRHHKIARRFPLERVRPAEPAGHPGVPGHRQKSPTTGLLNGGRYAYT